MAEQMTNPSPASFTATSLTLLERVRGSDEQAWRRLAALYGPLVYGWARRSGLKAEDAADVVQEVFATLARKIADFRRDRPQDTFRGWLWTITRHKVVDHLRHVAGQAQAAGGSSARVELEQLADTEASEPSGTGPARAAVERGLLLRALELMQSEFEPKTWRAFWLVAVDGRLAADAGRELGLSKHAVHQAKYRVLRRLRQELSEDLAKNV